MDLGQGQSFAPEMPPNVQISGILSPREIIRGGVFHGDVGNARSPSPCAPENPFGAVSGNGAPFPRSAQEFPHKRHQARTGVSLLGHFSSAAMGTHLEQSRFDNIIYHIEKQSAKIHSILIFSPWRP
jgi:hypothetical protein